MIDEVRDERVRVDRAAGLGTHSARYRDGAPRTGRVVFDRGLDESLADLAQPRDRGTELHGEHAIDPVDPRVRERELGLVVGDAVAAVECAPLVLAGLAGLVETVLIAILKSWGSRADVRQLLER